MPRRGYIIIEKKDANIKLLAPAERNRCLRVLRVRIFHRVLRRNHRGAQRIIYFLLLCNFVLSWCSSCKNLSQSFTEESQRGTEDLVFSSCNFVLSWCSSCENIPQSSTEVTQSGTEVIYFLLRVSFVLSSCEKYYTEFHGGITEGHRGFSFFFV